MDQMRRGIDDKLTRLREIAKEVDSQPNWWRFPTEAQIQGFLGTAPLFIVGDQPSTSDWAYSNPNRRALYDSLMGLGVPNAHITDLYKKRGKAGGLRQRLPEDFNEHIKIFRRELQILQPTRIVALGN